MKFEEMIKEMRESQTDVSAKWEDVFNMSYVPVYLNFDWGLNSDGTIPCLRYVAPYIWHTAHYSLEKRIAEGVWIPFSLNAEDIFHGNWEKVNMYDLDPSDSNDPYQSWRQEYAKRKQDEPELSFDDVLKESVDKLKDEERIREAEKNDD